MDYPLPPRHHEKNGAEVDFATVGGRLTEFRGQRFVRALDDITIEVKNGERLALLGGNGSGKSTLLKVMGGLLPLARGSVETRGRVTTLFNTAVGMDVNLSGYENLERLAALHNLPRAHAAEIREDIAEFTELGGFLKLPVKTYSAGMRTRLGFAFATSLPAEILLIDEVIGVGDTSFFQRARDRLIERMHDSGIVVLASHSVGLLRNFCSRGVVLKRGEVQFVGDIEEAISNYQLSVRRISALRPLRPITEADRSCGKAAASAVPATPNQTPAEPPRVVVEVEAEPGQRLELHVRSTKTHGRPLTYSAASRATIASFRFFDGEGKSLEGGYEEFHHGLIHANFIYLTGAQRAGTSRNTRFSFILPKGAHRIELTLKPHACKEQQFASVRLWQVASGLQDQAGLPPFRGAHIDATMTALKRNNWEEAGDLLKSMLAWPVDEIGLADLRKIDQPLLTLSSRDSAALRPVLKTLLTTGPLPRSGLTDRIALAWFWGLLRSYVSTKENSLVTEMRDVSDRLTAELGDFAAPWLCTGALAMLNQDRAAAYSAFRKAAQVEAFDAPLAHRFVGAYSVRDYGELLRWGESALIAAESEQPRSRQLEWLDRPAGSLNNPTLLLAGDARAFLTYGIRALAALNSLGESCDLHFHVVNWTAECGSLRQTLLESSARQITFSAESYADVRDRSYLAIVPYLRAREVMETLKAPLVIAGMEGALDFDPAALIFGVGDADFGSWSSNSSVPFPWHSPASRPAVARNTPAGRTLLRLLEDYVDAFYVSNDQLSFWFERLALNDCLHLMQRGGPPHAVSDLAGLLAK